MRFDEVIYLMSETTTQDEIGNNIETEIPRMVYANEWELSSSEYYAAASQGLKPERRWEIYSFEYQGEDELIHEDIRYRIIRTQKKGEWVRLTCEKVSGNA